MRIEDKYRYEDCGTYNFKYVYIHLLCLSFDVYSCSACLFLVVETPNCNVIELYEVELIFKF